MSLIKKIKERYLSIKEFFGFYPEHSIKIMPSPHNKGWFAIRQYGGGYWWFYDSYPTYKEALDAAIKYQAEKEQEWKDNQNQKNSKNALYMWKAYKDNI